MPCKISHGFKQLSGQYFSLWEIIMAVLITFKISTFFFSICFLFMCFSSHLETPIKTETDMLAENQVLPSSTPQSPRQDAKATVRSPSAAKWENQKKSFTKTNSNRKKNYNFHSLFEPRTHHPYLLEMVGDFSLHCSPCVS